MTDLKTQSLYMAQHCVWLRVRQASRALTSLYDSHLQPAGILSSQLTILSAITVFGSKEVGFSELAEAQLMDKTTLSRNIKPLEAAGLVRVARSPTDARARILLLTPAGQTTLAAAWPLWEQAQQVVQKALTADALEPLINGLGKLTAAARP